MDRSSGMHGIVPIVDMVVSRLSACRKQQENAQSQNEMTENLWKN
jgi:preprotein translocase subunit YajC